MATKKTLRMNLWGPGDGFLILFHHLGDILLIIRHTTVSCIMKEKESQAGVASKRHRSKIGTPPPTKGYSLRGRGMINSPIRQKWHSDFDPRCREGTKLALRTLTSQDSGRRESEFALKPWPKNTMQLNVREI